MTVALTNNLFLRPYFDLEDNSFAVNVSAFQAWNNLFQLGSVTLDNSGPCSSCWEACDNLFDRVGGLTNSSLENAHNGYVTNYNGTNYSRLPRSQGYDVCLTNVPSYQSSYLGNYYYPTNDGQLSLLLQAGSRSASNATLYHYTTTTNQAINGTNGVNIGFHYVATDTNGIPLESCCSGVPDYLADANGDGLTETNEIPWNLAIAAQPQSTNVVQGTNATFSVTPCGTGPFSYQWLFNGTNNLTNANGSSYTVIAPSTNDAGSYSVVVSNAVASITSSNAVLTVTVPLAITTQPQGAEADQGGTNSFWVTVTGSSPVYQWWASGTSATIPLTNGAWNQPLGTTWVSGATGSTVTLGDINGDDNGYYYVVVTNLAGSVTSQKAYSQRDRGAVLHHRADQRDGGAGQ